MKTIKIKILVSFLLVGALIMGCNSSSGEGEHERHEHGEEEHGGHEEHGEEETVTLTELQLDAIGLKLVEIEQRNMNIGIQVTGNLQLAPQDMADISPILGGIVKEIMVIEGSHVTKGQILATLEHPDFIQLQQDYINSTNTLEYLEKDYNRQKKLYDENVGSGKEFQKIKADYNNKKSLVMALKIKLNMLGLNADEIAGGKIYSVVSIVSPMKGIVSLVETNVGAYVEPLSKLFEVVNNEKLHADFRVYEKDINKVKVGQKIFFTTTSHSGEVFESEIHAISPAFEENPKALHVHADIANDKMNLISGMYIQGKIIAENTLTTVLPEQAIVVNEDKSYIFIKVGGNDHDHGHGVEEAETEEHNHAKHNEEGHEHEENEAEEAEGHDHDGEEHSEEEDDDHDAEKDEHGHHEGHEEGKITFKMIEVITGVQSDGYVEVKLLTPLSPSTKIAGNGAYYLLAEMGKGETEHSH